MCLLGSLDSKTEPGWVKDHRSLEEKLMPNPKESQVEKYVNQTLMMNDIQRSLMASILHVK